MVPLYIRNSSSQLQTVPHQMGRLPVSVLCDQTYFIRFYRKNSIKILIRLRANFTQIKEAIRTHFHPEYDIKTKQNDIALIEVQEDIR
jgi:hypothetical protein